MRLEVDKSRNYEWHEIDALQERLQANLDAMTVIVNHASELNAMVVKLRRHWQALNRENAEIREIMRATRIRIRRG